jgi:hypothetical protein
MPAVAAGWHAQVTPTGLQQQKYEELWFKS